MTQKTEQKKTAKDAPIPKAIILQVNGDKIEAKFENMQSMKMLRKYLQIAKQVQKLAEA